MSITDVTCLPTIKKGYKILLRSYSSKYIAICEIEVFSGIHFAFLFPLNIIINFIKYFMKFRKYCKRTNLLWE